MRTTSAVEPGYFLHIGCGDLTIWCPTCDDYLFENDGDQYNQNFESPLSLNALNYAVQLHSGRHHGKPQEAHQQLATAPPAPTPTDPTNTPYTPTQGAAPADHSTNVDCTHGKRLQRDYCAACETAEQTPHHYSGVQVRDRHTGRTISRCVDCGLPRGYTVHTWETP